MNTLKQNFDTFMQMLPSSNDNKTEFHSSSNTDIIDLMEESSEISRQLADMAAISGFWSDGTQILCRTYEENSKTADFLEKISCMNGLKILTGYYDPLEDERSSEEDDHTGYWYIEIE